MKDNLAKSLPWKEIGAIDWSKFNAIPDDVFVFATDPENYDQMFKSAMSSLKKENAKVALEDAEKLVKNMQVFAEAILQIRKLLASA
ncbi:MAG: hypothetical protein K8L91_15735 [Anaerolineae bacterium]|nr:hypothetical protein [Anaerolineae bacterium]